MESDIRDALADLKDTVNRRFDAVDKRIDGMVTRGEHEATVERLDAQHATLRRDFDSHESTTERITKGFDQKLDTAKANLRGEMRTSREEIGTALAEQRATARWAINLAITALGLLIAAGVLQIFTNR